MTKNYKQFSEVYEDENSYEVVADFLRKRIQYLDIHEWVSMEDLYVDESGNIYYVDFYKHTPQIEEGHGFHDVGTDEPEAYNLLISVENYYEIMKQRGHDDAIADEERAQDLKPWQWIIVLSAIVVLVWAMMWIVIPQ